MKGYNQHLKTYADQEPKKEAWAIQNLCSCSFCEVMGIDQCGIKMESSCTDYIHAYLLNAMNERKEDESNDCSAHRPQEGG